MFPTHKIFENQSVSIQGAHLGRKTVSEASHASLVQLLHIPRFHISLMTKLQEVCIRQNFLIIYQNIDSLLLDWKLRVLYFFHGCFFLEYANSSNQRDFFLLDSLALRIYSNQISRIRVTAKKFRNKNQLFFFNALLFLSVRLFLVYYKESMIKITSYDAKRLSR